MRHPCVVTQDTNKYLRQVDEALEKEEWICDKADELIEEYDELIRDFYKKDAKANEFFSELLQLADIDELDRMIRGAYVSRTEGRDYWGSFIKGLIEKRAMLDAELAYDRLMEELE